VRYNLRLRTLLTRRNNMDHELIRIMAEFGMKVQEKHGLLGKFLGLFQPKRMLKEGLKTQIIFQAEANETWIHLKHGQIETKALLKPLKELFCSEDEVTAVDTEDEDHLEMLEAIEEAILIFYEHHPEITDTDVLMTLDRLSKFLGRDNFYAKDSLAAAIETKLRMTLSFTEYSFRDVRKFLNCILRSVERRKKVNGPRGYLDFIKEQFENVDADFMVKNYEPIG